MLKNLKNTEFSKRLLYFVTDTIVILFILVTISVFKGMYEPLVALIAGVFSLASVAFGFYYWKAKNENIRKYAKNLNNEQFDQMLKLAKIILSGEDIEGEEDERI